MDVEIVIRGRDLYRPECDADYAARAVLMKAAGRVLMGYALPENAVVTTEPGKIRVFVDVGETPL